MSYFDEIRRIQRMYQDLDAVGRLRREVERVSKASSMVDPIVESLRQFNREHESAAAAFKDQIAAGRTYPAADGTLQALQEELRRPRELGDSIAKWASPPALQELLARSYSPRDEFIQTVQEQLRQQRELSASISKLASLPAYDHWTRATGKALQDLNAGYDLARSFGVDRFAEELRQSTDWIRNIRAAASPVLNMLADELLGSVSRGSLSPALVEGFGAELLDHIAQVEAAESEEEIITLLQAVLAWIIEQARKFPGMSLSSDALLGIFLTILSLVYGQWSSNQSEERIKETIRQEARESRQKNVESEGRVLKRMEELKTELVEELGPCRPEGAARMKYVVLESARLRHGPGKDFEPLRVLPPNLVVEEVGRDGEWLNVEFFDYVVGEIKKGWIAEELLREITDELK